MKTSISNQTDLTSENVERILSENGFENQDLSVDYLTYKKTGYGHWKLSVDISKGYETITLSKTTTDSMLIDSWNEDEAWFEEHDWYESNEDVFSSAFSSIMSSEANQELLQDFLNELENE